MMQNFHRVGLDLREMLYVRQSGKCFYCGIAVPLLHGNVDHRQPLAKGGTTTYDNCCFSCQPCNTAKGARTLEEYRHAMQGITFPGERYTTKKGEAK